MTTPMKHSVKTLINFKRESTVQHLRNSSILYALSVQSVYSYLKSVQTVCLDDM